MDEEEKRGREGECDSRTASSLYSAFDLLATTRHADSVNPTRCGRKLTFPFDWVAEALTLRKGNYNS